MRIIRFCGYALGVAALFYALLCGLLFFTQRSLIYFPQPRSSHNQETILTLPSPIGPALVSTRPHEGANALIYFGGNAEDVSQDLPDLETTFPDYAIYLLHYPGYGGSAGKPSEQVITEDAFALFDLVYKQHKNILVIGRSLGTGPAVHLASVRPVSRLVLVTPYDSLIDPAAAQYPYLPVRWLLLDTFDSGKYAPNVTAPTTILVAQNDEVIPRSSTDKLRTRFTKTTVKWTVVPNAGHNSISDNPAYWSLLKK